MRRTTPGVFTPSTTAPLPYSAELVEAALAPLVLEERLRRIDAVARARISAVTVALEAVTDPHNAAAILRTADGFGVGEVHFVDRGVRPLVAPRITRGCEHWMDIVCHRGTQACVAALEARGYELWVADARSPSALEELAARPRVALVFGNEHEGASAEFRRVARGSFAIPMRGMAESFNVSVAAGIALHAVTRGRAGDLGEEGVRALRARFLMESVREAGRVIERYLRDRGGPG